MSQAKMHEYIINRYDGLSFIPEILEYYSNSHYLNFGFWNNETSTQLEACNNLMEELISLLPEKNGPILDVACGKGATTSYLQKYYTSDKITGINISDTQLKIAKENAPKCNFIKMNATEMLFDDHSFETILSVEAAFHFYTREIFFRESMRTLKPGGYLVLSDILMSMKGEQESESRTEKNYLRDLKAYEDLLRVCGYINIKVIDVTEECWKRHFWHMVRYCHKPFLEKKITRKQLQEWLSHTYRRAEDLEYYLLAFGQTPY